MTTVSRRGFLIGLGALAVSACQRPDSGPAILPEPSPTVAPAARILPPPAPIASPLSPLGRTIQDGPEVRGIFERLYWEITGDVLDPSLRIHFRPREEYIARNGEGSLGLNAGLRDVEIWSDRPFFDVLSTLGHEVLGHNYHVRTFPAFEARETDSTLREAKGFGGEMALVRHLEDAHQITWYRVPDTGNMEQKIRQQLDIYDRFVDSSGLSALKWYSRSLISLWNETLRNPDRRAMVLERGALTGQAAWALNVEIGTRYGRRYWEENGNWSQEEKELVVQTLLKRVQPASIPAEQRGLVGLGSWDFLLP